MKEETKLDVLIKEETKLDILIWVSTILVTLSIIGLLISAYKWGYSIGFETAKKEFLQQQFHATHELHEVKEALILIKK